MALRIKIQALKMACKAWNYPSLILATCSLSSLLLLDFSGVSQHALLFPFGAFMATDPSGPSRMSPSQRGLPRLWLGGSLSFPQGTYLIL